jgi:hypothetical protein
MTNADRIKYLRVALTLTGLIFTFGLWPLTIVWPSGWSWHTEGRSYYLEMMIGLYATLGVFLLLAARNPLLHRSLIWFTVWSSIVHGGVMAVQSFQQPPQHGPSLGRCPGAVCRGGRVGRTHCLAKPETKEPMTHPASRMLPSALLFASFLAFSAWAGAANLSVLVLDKEGKPTPDAVVVVVPSAKTGAPKPAAQPGDDLPGKDALCAGGQRGGLGAKAQFVNNDPWEHHVRASAAGVAQFNAAAGEGFELRLDGKPEGKPARTADATFTKAGAVLLGCHIHGSMRGHVYVSESPWAVLTNAEAWRKSSSSFPKAPRRSRSGMPTS